MEYNKRKRKSRVTMMITPRDIVNFNDRAINPLSLSISVLYYKSFVDYIITTVKKKKNEIKMTMEDEKKKKIVSINKKKKLNTQLFTRLHKFLYRKMSVCKSKLNSDNAYK